MDKIINLLLLVIIFVFDPLAVSLVIAANFAYNKAYPKRKFKDNLYGEKVEIKQELPDEARGFPPNYNEESERRMDIIGQNGNDGEHYDELDINKDGNVDSVDKEIVKRRLNEISKLQQTKSLTQEWRKNLNQEQISLQNKLDDLTKRY